MFFSLFFYDSFFYKKSFFCRKKQDTKSLNQKGLKKRSILSLQIILLSLCLSSKVSFSKDNCREVFLDIQSFNKAMTENLILHSHQENLFEFYKNESFIKPMLTLKSLNDVVKILEKYPETNKIPLREYTIHIKQASHKSTHPYFDNLQQFIKSLSQSASKVKNNLFNIKENIGYWKNLLDFPKQDKKDSKNNLKKQQHNSEFLEYLNTLISKEDFHFLKDPSRSNKEKSLLLYQILNKARDLNLQQNKTTKRISQAMVDIVHIFALNDDYNKTQLKHKNPDQQIETLYKINKERDNLAKKLGFKSFLDLQSQLDVSHPTGLSKNQDILSYVESLERDINIQEDNTSIETLRVRPLSLQEAPFRSCLSGDCASQTYFERALDPNFHYFTLTNENHVSSGHITVVLGSAKKNKEPIPTAFVDKIQNIPEDTILPMLESIRLSLKEQGYTLGIPQKVGRVNALSDTNSISEYISNKVNPHLNQTLKKFMPHENNYNFKFGFSRAYDKLNLLEFKLTHTTQQKLEITEGALHKPVLAPKDLDFQTLLENILKLQNSEKEEDQIRFIANLSTLYKVKEANINFDFIKDSLYNKIINTKLSFKLRKFALFHWIEFLEKQVKHISYQSFLELLSYFSNSEEKIILGEISNWKKSSNEYRKSFIYHLTLNFLLQMKDIKEFSNSKLKKILDIHAINSFDSVLTGVLWKNNIESAQRLLALGADINAKSKNEETALMLAGKHGKIENVKWLLQNGADINVKNKYGETALMIAIEYENTEAIDLFLKNGADINAKNNYGYTALMLSLDKDTKTLESLLNYDTDIDIKNNYGETALMIAVEQKNTKVVELLLKNGADINTQSIFGQTALMTATTNEDKRTIDILLKNGIDINAQNNLGHTVLMRATQNNRDVEILKFLLKNNADVNIKDNNGKTALMMAITYKNTKAIDLFLKNGADINTQDNFGHTVLITAVDNKDISTIEALLNYGANINSQTNFGYTALMTAVDNKDISTIEALLNYYGANINTQTNFGYTALMTAVDNKDISTIDLLLNYGANINTQNTYGKTALMMAVDNKDTITVELLLNYDADINTQDNFGYTALMGAVDNKDISTIETLLNYDADINTQNEYGETALMIAVNSKDISTIETLLNYDADINTQNEYGETALMIAVNNKDILSIKSLLNYGADINAQNKHNGKTALWYAEHNNYTDIVQLLKKHGAKKWIFTNIADIKKNKKILKETGFFLFLFSVPFLDDLINAIAK